MSIDPRIVIGCYAVDPVWYKVGQVMAVNGDRIRLQPLLGGPEWDALLRHTFGLRHPAK
ncbi:hypothetical protein GCM10020000_29900 [Streptomyces olivoverticillatus]